MLPQTAVSTRKRGRDANFRKKINDKMKSTLWFLQRFTPVDKTARLKIVFENGCGYVDFYCFLCFLLVLRLIIYYLKLINAKKPSVVSYFVVELLVK